MAELNLLAILASLIVNIIVLSPVLWIAGRLLVGKDKAKFTDALWIVILGTIIGAVFQILSLGIVGSIIMLIVWLGLIKHFFDAGWLMSLAIAIVAIVVYIIIVVILALLFGLALVGAGFLL